MKKNEFLAQAGTLESCDALITVKRGESKIELDSVVSIQYKDVMMGKIQAVIDKLGERDLEITIIDKGAVNFVLQAAANRNSSSTSRPSRTTFACRRLARRTWVIAAAV